MDEVLNYSDISFRFDKLIASAKVKLDEAKQDGLTPAEVFGIALALLHEAIEEAVRLAAEYKNAVGPAKKELVIAAVEKFYFEVIAPIDLPYIPNFVIEPIVDQSIGSAIRPLVGGLVERVYSLLRPQLA